MNGNDRRMTEPSGTDRRIIHIDMDAFYASVEQRDNPDLRGRPVAVGGSSRRGVVAAASYEARRFGVRSAMPSVTAARKCPELVFVKPRFEVYKAVSLQIREIFGQYTELIEPLSLDEAFLDVSHLSGHGGRTATGIANEIRRRVLDQTALTCSAGVSFNKFLAKVASDYHKPNGITVVRPDQVERFLGQLPIEKFHGIGRVTAERFHKLGVRTGEDLRGLAMEDLMRNFGKSGSWYYRLARGIDERSVHNERRRKSIGAERTYFEDSDDAGELHSRLDEVLDRLWGRIDAAAAGWRTVTVKIKFFDFDQITRSRSTSDFVSDKEELRRTAHELLRTPESPRRPVRLLGVSVSNLRLPGDRDAVDQNSAQLILPF